jgi:4-hydroxythreonine-4-phosphate dehydrogenase
MKTLTVVITIGDPSGIGPEVALKALTYRYPQWVLFFLVGDSFILNKVAKQSGLKDVFKRVVLVDLKNVNRDRFEFSGIDVSYGMAAVEYIKKAVDIIKAKKADTLVTAPISKEAINSAGFKWPGHTEYLAHLTKTKKFCMMLTGGSLRVVLATRHIALKDIPGRLNSGEIYNAIAMTAAALKKYFRVKRPKIAVAALNPHAGEGGMFSDEEKRIIIPAIKKIVGARHAWPLHIVGPLPADSLFYDAYRGKYDAEIVMYHDQGLIPLKMIARDTAVNVTLGLPFVRTSVAHGTAFDIAGKNKANPSSMIEAIKLACQLAAR